MELTAFRRAAYDTPLWVNPNRQAGRWHRTGSDPTQYWSLHPLGPWAELLRALHLVEQADLVDLASRTWAATFHLTDETVAEITFDTAARWAISPEALVGDDHRPCQQLAERVRATHQALVVPSAALPGTSTLVVFGPRLASPYGSAPVDAELDVPAAVTAEHGGPPDSLLPVVCHRGAAHAGLAAWRQGVDLAPPPWR